MSKVNIESSTVNVLLELGGEVHLVAMHPDKYEAVSILVKAAAETIIKTGKTQTELLHFLNYTK
ncbi:hypothetical protein BEP19_09910 [Ammoniphilus oxalaticus]|uniref:Uncharacterized protein n=1 Tax=Ammoniphilus oxalaticus TaxID=66863 RepID=A0A419SFK6_9BACL|nr:hypothetical protein [Ammoniphilus oxalaticus]RKD22566.1 hypothetical protein BEP19_09910 [Ammoniphilus oxalaticus]